MGEKKKANLQSVLPKYHQYVSSPTRGPNTRDYCCTPKMPPTLSPDCTSCEPDHLAVFLLPSYKQKLKKDPVQNVMQSWSEAKDEIFHDCFESVYWPIFKDSVANLIVNATAATDYNSKCVQDGVPKMTICMPPPHHKKPWMNWKVDTQVKSKTAAYKSNDSEH